MDTNRRCAQKTLSPAGKVWRRRANGKRKGGTPHPLYIYTVYTVRQIQGNLGVVPG